MSLPKTIQRLVEKHPDKINEAWSEAGTGDGYWIDLQFGWQWADCHCVHGWTVKALLESFKEVKPCQCRDCMEAIEAGAKKRKQAGKDGAR